MTKLRYPMILFCVALCSHFGLAGNRNDGLSQFEKRKQEIAQQKEKREKARAERELYNNPPKFYRQRIQGRFSRQNDQIEYLNLELYGEVLQVLDDHNLLLSDFGIWDHARFEGKPHEKGWVWHKGRTCVIRLPSTQGWVDGEKFPWSHHKCQFIRVRQDGTFEYTTVLGAKRTVTRYIYDPGISLDDYLTLRQKKLQFKPLTRREKYELKKLDEATRMESAQ